MPRVHRTIISPFVIGFAILCAANKIPGHLQASGSAHNYLPLDHLRVHPLVKIQAHGIVLLDGLIENNLHQTVRSDWLLDVPGESVLRYQLRWLEPLYVLGSVEHVLDHSFTFSHANRISCQHNPFENNAIRIDT